MENDVSKVASIKRQHIRHVRLHFFAAGYHSRYWIIEFTATALPTSGNVRPLVTRSSPISYPEPAIFRRRIESSGIIHNRKPEILAFFARLLHSLLYQQPIRFTQIHGLSQSSRFLPWRSRARGTRLVRVVRLTSPFLCMTHDIILLTRSEKLTGKTL